MGSPCLDLTWKGGGLGTSPVSQVPSAENYQSVKLAYLGWPILSPFMVLSFT